MVRIIRNRKEIQEVLNENKNSSNKQIQKAVPVPLVLSRREFKARYGASALADTPEDLQYQQQRSLTKDFTNHKPQSKFNY